MSEHLVAACNALEATQPDGGGNPALRIHLGRCFLALEDAVSARRMAQTILADDADNPAALVLFIDAAVLQKDFPAALDAIEQSPEKLAKSDSILKRKSRILRLAGQTADRLPVLSMLHDARPNDIAVQVDMARAYAATGDLERAQHSFLKILDIDETNVPAWLGSIDLAVQRKDHEAACALAETALARFPGNAVIVDKAARALIKFNRSGLAKSALEGAVADIRPLDQRLVLTFVSLLRRYGEYGRAEQLIDRLLGDAPDNPQAWRNRIQIAIDVGDIDGALAHARESLTRCPENHDLILQHAATLSHARREGEAIRLLEALAKRHPDQTRVAIALADAYRTAARLHDAERVYNAILKREPQNRLARRGCVAIFEARGDADAAMRMAQDDGQAQS